jgi:hypothetical protein
MHIQNTPEKKTVASLRFIIHARVSTLYSTSGYFSTCDTEEHVTHQMLARAYTLPLLLYGLQAPNRLLNNQAKVSKKQLPSKRNHQSPDLQIFLIDHSGDDIRFCHTSMLYSLARPAKPSRPDPAYPSSTQPPRKKPVKAGANRTDQLRFISSTSTRRR